MGDKTSQRRLNLKVRDPELADDSYHPRGVPKKKKDRRRGDDEWEDFD